MPSSTTQLVDLRETLRSLVTEVGSPHQVWLFGSRAYGTRSTRSDIDLLIIDPAAVVDERLLLEWRRADLPDRRALDFFISHDPVDSPTQMARSVINGSVLKRRQDLAGSLHAVLLWSDGALVQAEGVPWRHDIDAATDFRMTVIPTDFSRTLQELPRELDRLGLPNTFMGSDWGQVVAGCAAVAERALTAMPRLDPRAQGLTDLSVYPTNEYGVQNLLQLVLKPWLPDLERNPFVVKYGGQEKIADFAAAGSQLMVEVKFVKADASSSAAALKQLDGLAELYALGPTVKAILFLAVCEWGVSTWDGPKIDFGHTNMSRSPVILTRSVSLPAPPSPPSGEQPAPRSAPRPPKR